MASEQLLSDTGIELEVTGDKKKGDGYYGFSDGQHTVGFYMDAFIGRFWIEATLATDPTSDDWFAITLDGESATYIQYDSLSPGNGLLLRNFQGNYTWVRAVVSRSHIAPTPDPLTTGKLRQVLLNH